MPAPKSKEDEEAIELTAHAVELASKVSASEEVAAAYEVASDAWEVAGNQPMADRCYRIMRALRSHGREFVDLDKEGREP